MREDAEIDEVEQLGELPKRRSLAQTEQELDLDATGGIPRRLRQLAQEEQEVDLEATGGIPRRLRQLAQQEQEIDLEATGGIPRRLRQLAQQEQEIDLEATGGIPRRLRQLAQEEQEIDLEATGGIPRRLRQLAQQEQEIDLEATGGIPRRLRQQRDMQPENLEGTGTIPRPPQGSYRRERREELGYTGKLPPQVPKEEPLLDLGFTGPITRKETKPSLLEDDILDFDTILQESDVVQSKLEGTGKVPRRLAKDEKKGTLLQGFTGKIPLVDSADKREESEEERVPLGVGATGGELEKTGKITTPVRPTVSGQSTSSRQTVPSRVKGGRPSEKKEKKKTFITVLSVCLLLFTAVGGGYLWRSIVNEVKEQEERPVPDVTLLMPDEGEFISYQGLRIPVHMDVPVNSFDGRGFYENADGYMFYEVDGVLAIPGIDVSYHQQNIDWYQVAEAGFEFAMIRAGRRGYGEEGSLASDVDYKENIQGAIDNGMEVGVYFFSQAINMEEVEEEVSFLLDLIAEFDITYPVVFDWEFIATADARTDLTTGEEITEMAVYFCQRVEEAGYIPGVYFNMDMAYKYMDISQLKDYPFWLAELTNIPRFYYHFDIWQYTFTGNVPGIVGDVDLNLSFRDFATESYNLRKEREAT